MSDNKDKPTGCTPSCDEDHGHRGRGFTKQSPYRSDGKTVVCDLCFERWRFLGPDADAARAKWKIITSPILDSERVSIPAVETEVPARELTLEEQSEQRRNRALARRDVLR